MLRPREQELVAPARPASCSGRGAATPCVGVLVRIGRLLIFRNRILLQIRRSKGRFSPATQTLVIHNKSAKIPAANGHIAVPPNLTEPSNRATSYCYIAREETRLSLTRTLPSRCLRPNDFSCLPCRRPRYNTVGSSQFLLIRQFGAATANERRQGQHDVRSSNLAGCLIRS